jgi:threonine aldolase
VGVLAAAALYALDHNLGRLGEDHVRARALARGLAGIEGLEVDPDAVETNIVRLGVGALDADAFLAALAAEGVLASHLDAHTVRFVTHLNVDDDAVAAAVAAAAKAVAAVA